MRDSRLKRWLHILAGTACAAASIACAVTAWPGSETIKSFHADAAIKDVGVLHQQEEKDAVFHLINATDSPVEIVRVSTSCTCTRAEPAARNLQPGESTELKAQLRVGSRRGKVAALVNVLYRVGDVQSVARLPLTITASVEPHYAVTPEEVLFEVDRRVGEDLHEEADITIAPNRWIAVRVLKAYSTHPAVRVTMIRREKGVGTTSIHLNFDPCRLIASSTKAAILVHTDSKLEPIHRVPVRVVSKGSK